MMAEQIETDNGVKRERSPSSPFISLKKAVERAETLYISHKKVPARLANVAETWAYGERSSGLLQTAAALKQYGLISDFGSGPDRKIQLTDLALKILTDARPGAKEQAVKEAALKPKLIAEYCSQWLPERPVDSHCISELTLERGFTDVAAKAFIKVFDETVSYANLQECDSVSSNLEKTAEEARVYTSPPKGEEMQHNQQVRTYTPNSIKKDSPLSVSIKDDKIEVMAVLTDQKAVERLINTLTATKSLLPEELSVEKLAS